MFASITIRSVIIIVLIITLGSYQLFYLFDIKFISPAFSQANQSSSIISNTSSVSLPELFKKVKDSVVKITVTGDIPNPHILVNGTPIGDQFRSRGSGFIYDKDGHIITNYHVVNNSQTISISFLDGNSYSANIVGIDGYSDLAVLQVDSSALFREQLKPLSLANSSSVEVGQPVVAIGNPLGLTGSMTQGIISQTNRIAPDALTGKFLVADLIQTDAAINPGNSGGPLLDLNGEVIGVNELGGTYAGIGFTIPSNTVQRIVPQLLSRGSYTHAWLGMHIFDVLPSIAENIGLKEAKGVVVVDVKPGSPADLAGLKGIEFVSNNNNTTSGEQIPSAGGSGGATADVILGIDDKLVRDMSDLINYLDIKSPGDNVLLKVFRSDGIIHNVDVKVGERPVYLQNSTNTNNNNNNNTINQQ
jgi:S1-C subfamily serine protease